jgi:electron transfer flavoprotein beta subunit
MKIVVPVKRVIDFNVRVRVKADGSGVETENVKMSMNPFDENALEAALTIKEANQAEEVVAVSVGPAKAEETLRVALAMGADRALLVEADGPVEPLAVAKILAAVAGEESAGLVIAGKQAIDDDANQTGQMLAGLLGWAQATAASRIEMGEGMVRVVREVDGGLQTIEIALPAVISADLRLNAPRYASLPNVMKARSKPMEKKSPADFGVDMAPRLTVERTEAPPARKAGTEVNSVAELVDKLRTEARVI